jgi:hypothetical protein
VRFEEITAAAQMFVAQRAAKRVKDLNTCMVREELFGELFGRLERVGDNATGQLDPFHKKRRRVF